MLKFGVDNGVEDHRAVVDNYDGSAASTMELIQDDKLDQWSQEIRFISTSSEDFTWVAGANISNENVDAYDLFDDSFFLTDSVFDGTIRSVKLIVA